MIEPFNLRDERDGGHFDENMNYVFQRERGEKDAWVAAMDEATMEQSIGEAAKALKVHAKDNLYIFTFSSFNKTPLFISLCNPFSESKRRARQTRQPRVNGCV